ncbi:pro-Pol polyprotein [Trichonephila clavipes]|nr:pro-Pol polyprotein [Trichonephila clavipes]
MRKLLAGEPIPMKSKLTPLDVFLDESNIIRVGGRLANSNLNEKAKFPMILPSRNVLTDIILSHYHKKYLHAGPHSLLYLVRQKFWPLNGRNNCRRIIHECVNCFKNKPITMNQIMANLPRDRVTPNYPFNVTGVDFAGPFFIKFKNQRKGALNKIYVVVYVCLCTKAIHLDFVTDLTSQAFIASLKRFFGRRGKCAKITTDNAKTFVGANAEIKKLFKMIKLPDHTLAEFLTNESIEWNFIPPRSPNHGGLLEAGVKEFKFHLKRVVGNAHLTLEEFITILCEIEAVLNSRPLTPLTSNFDDFETLTPGHFLVGRPLTSIVEAQITNINENQLSRWERVKKITQHIYKLWKRDYLNNLQERHKWKFNKNNVSVGTLVLIKDENLPSTKWSTGRITEIFPGTDVLGEPTPLATNQKSAKPEEIDEKILEVKIIPQEKNTVSDTSTNKDTLSKEKESKNENEETKLIRNDFAHYVGTPIDADLREQILKLGPCQPEAKCRGQGYDGEANMRGANKGLEKLIKDKQPRANYVHCSTHNLNLVLNDACNNVPHNFIELKVKLIPGFINEELDALFICYEQSPDNAGSVALSQRANNPRLFEDETFDDSDIINNLVDYENGQEELDPLRANKNMQGSSFLTN